jgi:galactonate dehydratase
MRIESLTTHICDAYRLNWVFVKVVTDDGLHGWGEGTLEYRPHAVIAAIRELERGLIGREASAIESWWQDAYRDAYWRGGVVLTTALSAVEMALWDIKGKALGVPVYELLGGPVRKSVPCYANGWFAGAKSPDEFAERARATVAAGFKALKWDPFGASFRSISPPELRTALGCVEAVKHAVGDSADLLIEGHGRFEYPAALRIAQALEDYDVLWFEEPLVPTNTETLARLQRATRTPLAVGERFCTRWEFREALEKGAAAYLQPDVSHVGGIFELRKVAAMAETWQVAICPHNPSGPVANAATLQLAACTPNIEYLETMATDVPWRNEVARETCSFADGRMSISTKPGLGVELDEAAIELHPYIVRDLRHYTGALTDIRPAGDTAYY